jgi:transposase
MDLSALWVGLDIGEVTTSICVLGPDDKPVLERRSGSSAQEIAEALSCFEVQKFADIIVESGAEQGLARTLRGLGYPVTLVDSGKAQRFLGIRQNKTDRNDARGLADIARLGRSKSLSVWVRGEECETLRAELVIRDQLVRQRTAIRCCLRSLLRRHGSSLKKVALGTSFCAVVEVELDAIAGTAPRRAIRQIEPLLEVSETLSRIVSDADKRILEFAKSNAVTKRFLAIPGVGPICAVSFYSVIEDPQRFLQTNDVGAYLGMVPKFKQSGTAFRRTSISKAGNTMTRGHLYLSAGVMLSRAAQQSAIGDWGKALAARRGYKLARVAVARKLALAMLSIWKHGCDFEPYPGGTTSRRGEVGLDSGSISRAASL